MKIITTCSPHKWCWFFGELVGFYFCIFLYKKPKPGKIIIWFCEVEKLSEVNNSNSGPEIIIEVYGQTDVGKVRETNEDSFLIADLFRHLSDLTSELRRHRLDKGGTIFVVCDGMGGAQAGEVASRMAIETILEIMEREPFPTSHTELALRMDSAMKEASERIFISARRDLQKRGMGTTITMAALIDPRLIVAQVGDSRCYLFRKDTIYRITRDQSLLTQLLDSGQLNEEEAKDFEYSNVILQAAGTQKTLRPEFTFVDLQRGDMILMCSDGLHSMVEDEVIAYTLLNAPTIDSACNELVELANKAGGSDNITVVIARFTGDGLPSQDDSPVMYEPFDIEADTEVEPEGKWDFPEVLTGEGEEQD